jgi:hypothetical protein
MVGGPYFLASLALLAVLFLSYAALAYKLRRSRRLDAGEIATLAGAAFGVPAGVRIVIVALTGDLGELSGLADRGYILIGPLIVITGIVVAVGRIFRNIWQGEELEEEDRSPK